MLYARNWTLIFSILFLNTINRPCGSLDLNLLCMEQNKCTKHSPRAFKQETCTRVDGYPIYHRQAPSSGGITATIKRKNCSFQIDNSWMVPYSLFLIKMFNMHINMKSCLSVKSIKYICKYINKGDDMAVIDINQDNLLNNEVTQDLMGRYFSSNMAIWHIFGFNIHQCCPPFGLGPHYRNDQ